MAELMENKIIYLTRESFCLADDCNAPHMRSVTWRDCDGSPETQIFGIIEEYLSPNLPGFYWRGYADGKMLVDVDIHREDHKFSIEIKLVENWRDLLRESKNIHFSNTEYENRALLPSTIDNNY